MSMVLDDADIEGLARACARRFPGIEGQRPFAQAVGLGPDRTDVGDDVAGWSSLIRAAQSRGQLPVLARALHRAAPGDEILVALSRALGVAAAPPPTRFPVAMLGAVGAVLVLGAGVVWFTNHGDGAPPVAAGEAGAVAVAAQPGAVAAQPGAVAAPSTPPPAAAASARPTEAQPASAPAEPSTTPATPVPPGAATPAAGAPVARATTAEATTAEATSPKATSPAPMPTRVGCKGSPGQVVGYYYAGTTSPGSAGSTITLPRDARVRAEYPNAANGHDAKTPERCVLPRGTQLRLVQDPVDASNGHYWVPVVGE